MMFFKMLIGFTLLNVLLQVFRGSLPEAIVATIIFCMVMLADELWTAEK